ncbi:hypothetical protein SH611_07140 [Geminicoccaceae bacterium 1502E]|uniref:Uncharacterized protein n=1 Tax=Marinimicrococcus flavescens TaxID=3031815 RepID=A0AAP3XSV8_9PROT|nr:hypothetical protein [Marinimicrococcus flavescens]MDX6749574.1 hypothetical protein [Geminicoccaceae bacterium 1502E]
MSDRRRHLLALLTAAVMLFSHPVLQLVDALAVAGPDWLLPAYLFAAWAAVILAAALAVERGRRE